ncbi:MAG: hypothetical protein RXO54_04020 [Acidilobus sp.]
MLCLSEAYSDEAIFKGSAKAREVAKGFSYETFRARIDEVIRLLAAKGP